MTDEELIAEARRVAPALRGRIGADDRERLAAELLRQMADRLESRAAEQATADDGPVG